jgi:hypothetical protein
MKPVSINKTARYIPVQDRDLAPQDQTVFVLKALTAEEETILEDMLAVDGNSMMLNIGSKQLAAIQFGLVAVENFGDVVVTRDQFKGKFHGIIAPLAEGVLSSIPKDVRAELANAIMSNVTFEAQDSKN